MKKVFMLATCLFSVAMLNAQKSGNVTNVFRRNYNRIGINLLGNSLQSSLNPEQNILAGNFGAGTGFVLDAGQIYYFRKRNAGYKVNVGLDWTFFSLTYNKLSKWNSYGSGYDKGAFFDNVSASASTKLGPMVAYNPVSKLVIEGRFQVNYLLLINNLTYSEIGQSGQEPKEFFTFKNESIKSGFTASFGLSVRYGMWGVGFDYFKTNFSTPYTAKHPNQGYRDGEAKIPIKNLQFKLNFSF